MSLYGSLPQPDVISHNLAIAAAGAGEPTSTDRWQRLFSSDPLMPGQGSSLLRACLGLIHSVWWCCLVSVGRVELALSIVQPLLSSARPNAQCVTSAIKACTQAARHKAPHHWMDQVHTVTHHHTPLSWSLVLMLVYVCLSMCVCQAERLLVVLEAKGCADAPAYACLMTAFNRWVPTSTRQHTPPMQHKTGPDPLMCMCWVSRRGQGARVLSLYTRLRRHKLQPSPKVLTQVHNIR